MVAVVTCKEVGPQESAGILERDLHALWIDDSAK